MHFIKKKKKKSLMIKSTVKLELLVSTFNVNINQ